MIDNTWYNYETKVGDYFKTNSVSAETLRKFVEHFHFYDVEGLIENYTSNTECYFNGSWFVGTAGKWLHYSREIDIPEILYHINKPKNIICSDTGNIDEGYVFYHENFQPKEGDFFDLCKHTPEQRQWLQDNLKTYCNSDFIGSWSEEGKKGNWGFVEWDSGEFVGTNGELPRYREIHINDILV